VSTSAVELWIVLAGVGAVAVLTMLGRIAAAIEDDKLAYDMHQEAHRLRQRYAAQLAAERNREPILEVDVIEEEPPARAAA
jgi:hypothetical protein